MGRPGSNSRIKRNEKRRADQIQTHVNAHPNDEQAQRVHKVKPAAPPKPGKAGKP